MIIFFNNVDRSVSLERAMLISINFCLAISKEESMMLPCPTEYLIESLSADYTSVGSAVQLSQ